MELQKRQKTVSRGFTFVEIILALTLMAIATTIIVGIQGASVARSLRDTNAITATALARQIMAGIESTDKKLEPGEKTGKAVEIAREFGVEPMGTDEELAEFDRYTATYKIEEQAIPTLKKADQNVLQKLTLSVAWSEEPDDRIEILYYIPLEAM